MEKTLDELWGKTGAVSVSLEHHGIMPFVKVKVSYASGSHERGMPVSTGDAVIMDLASPDGAKELQVTMTRSRGAWTLEKSDGQRIKDTKEIKNLALGDWQVKEIHFGRATKVSVGQPGDQRRA